MGTIATAINRLKEELPSNVKLVAVSKFHPAEAVMEAYDAGQRVFGESRPQEFHAKAVALPGDISWHFIGHLQTNKLKLVLPYTALEEILEEGRFGYACEDGHSVLTARRGELGEFIFIKNLSRTETSRVRLVA